MTKRERAQVVELLRCAADPFETKRNRQWPTKEVATGENTPSDCSDPIYKRAWSAVFSVPFDEHGDGSFATKLLEAALRVEEGSWP